MAASIDNSWGVVKSWIGTYEEGGRDRCERNVKLARKICEENLKDGEFTVAAMFEDRAKEAASMKTKVEGRNLELIRRTGRGFKDHDEIRADMVDLSAMRIIMYYPHGDQYKAVDDMIRKFFRVVREPKEKNIGEEKTSISLEYSGIHYIVGFLQEHYSPAHEFRKKYLVEIQVRSTAYHVWASISHQLDYKPENGALFDDDKAIFRGVNGVVQSLEGMIAQLWVNQRRRQEPFSSKYELGKFLDDHIPHHFYQSEKQQKVPSETGSGLANLKNYGTIKILLRFLSKTGFDTQIKLKAILNELDFKEMDRKSTPKNVNRERIDDEFEGFTLKPSVYIIKHILNKSESTKGPLPMPRTYQEKTRVVISTFIWVHKLFIEYQKIQELLEDDKIEDFQEYRDFLYSDSLVYSILAVEPTGEADICTQEYREKMDKWWKWFESREAAPLKLVFRICRMGVLETLPMHLEKMKLAKKLKDASHIK